MFSPGRFADRIFNADDRAAELNGGSYSAIPIELRRQVNVEFEAFVRDSIAQRRSFALETTLRSRITFEQARAARLSGFQVIMTYVALDSFASHLERVTQRARRGGHSASESTLRRIHASSLANLSACLRPEESGFDELRIYDNSIPGGAPRLALTALKGKVIYLASDLPGWLQNALTWSDSDVAKIRKDLAYSFGA